MRELISILRSINIRDRLGVALSVLAFVGVGHLYRVNESLGFITVMIFTVFILGIMFGGTADNNKPEDDQCGNDNIKREPWKYM